MIKQKIKECKGWDGVSHPAFIYKRIGGIPYCKNCTFRLEPPKQISLHSKKGKEQLKHNKEMTEKQFKFFLTIWNKKPHYCEVTGQFLGNVPYSYFFDHLLEKSKYPEFRFNEDNIALVTSEVHSLKTNGKPLPKHQQLIDEAKDKLL